VNSLHWLFVFCDVKPETGSSLNGLSGSYLL